MILSDWRIIWDPAGSTPLVLLDLDEWMADEIAGPREQPVDVGAFDFAVSGQPVARGNVKRRIEFAVIRPRASSAASWDACQAALASDPWGKKSTLTVQARGGTVRTYNAALLSSEHTPASDGPTPESIHRYAWRITPA